MMMNASQFYALSRQLQNAYAAQMRPLCEETGMAQTAIDILLFLHNNPGCATAPTLKIGQPRILLSKPSLRNAA